MSFSRLTAFAAAATLGFAASAFAAAANEGQGQAVVTLMPKGNDAAAINLQQQNLTLKVDGKQSSIVSLTPAKGPGSPLELVILMDSSARTSLGTQLNDIANFVKEMPKTARIAIAYMQNGRAAFTGPLSSDAAQVLNGLHLPAGSPGSSASPYFCLSDLAKNWPSRDTTARREVIMITNGVDNYDRRLDLDDPYVQAAITDSVRSGLIIYTFYWADQGRMGRGRGATNAGQSLLQEVSDATGGNTYWEGFGNPVSFDPFFKDLRQRFVNQYKINFTAPLKNKPEVERLSLKLQGADAKIVAPQQVFVTRTGSTSGE